MGENDDGRFQAVDEWIELARKEQWYDWTFSFFNNSYEMNEEVLLSLEEMVGAKSAIVLEKFKKVPLLVKAVENYLLIMNDLLSLYRSNLVKIRNGYTFDNWYKQLTLGTKERSQAENCYDVQTFALNKLCVEVTKALNFVIAERNKLCPLSEMTFVTTEHASLLRNCPEQIAYTEQELSADMLYVDFASFVKREEWRRKWPKLFPAVYSLEIYKNSLNEGGG